MTLWSWVIHGGAGVIGKDMPSSAVQARLDGLRRALDAGRAVLATDGSALDAVEAAVRALEDESPFNAGLGSVFTHRGDHELDASIMDGRNLACGAVAGVRTVRYPVSLARQVMEKTRHVFLLGEGAEEFAELVGAERVPNSYFSTEERREQLLVAQRGGAAGESSYGKGTVGAVARDVRGHLAAATSTGGMTDKRFGRIGDSPIIGAGCFADDRTCAVSATGTGEEFIRHVVAKEISARMMHGGASLTTAVRAVVHEVLQPDDGGVIAVSPSGELVLDWNTLGMYRGAADSVGRFDVAIWS